MGKSGNPAVAAPQDYKKKSKGSKPAKTKAAPPTEASSAQDFKKASKGRMIELPSGLAVRAKRVQLQTFVAQGSVPNPLMALVQESLAKGGSMSPSDMVGVDKESIDMDMVKEMYDMVQAITVESIVEPRFLPVPEEGVERDDDLLYVDELDEEDLMFIYQWAVGGTDDVAQFREEARADMAAVAEGQHASPAAK